MLRFIPLFFGLCASLLTSSCLMIGPLDGGDAGSDAGKASDAGTATDAKASDVEAGADRGCVVDPLSRMTVCTVIGLCPTLAVDHDRFPNCGFRAGTGTID